MVAIEWAESDLELEDVGDDFDLYVYKGHVEPHKSSTNETPSVGSSQTTAARGTGESVTINDAPSGEYTIRVVYKVVIDAGYSGSATFLEAGVTPPPDPTPVEPDDCSPDHVWFLGTVYDRAQRADFKLDVHHFEAFLAKLRETYCIPDSQATILAMGKNAAGNNYTDDVSGKSYPEGSEANLKAELRRMGREADEHPDSVFFFFLSSHGLMWSGAHPESACKDPRRVVGSFAGLKPGGAEDGNLDDCELGKELNTSFSEKTRMLIVVDCSFCGGFSDSLTAVSGSVPDGGAPSSSGLPAPSSSGIPARNRVVVTGCAVTTECFGSAGGGITYWHMSRVLNGDIPCDGWTAPEFPKIQGLDVPVNGAPFNPPDGRCTASEWFFAAVQSAYQSATEVRGILGIQQQFRIKYGFESLSEDLVIWAPPEPTELSFTSDSPSSGQYSDTVTLLALLEDDQGAVEGAPLSFEIAGADEQRSFTAITGLDGRAIAETALSEAPGHYELTVRFDGDAGRGASSDSRVFTVDPEDSELALSVSGRGPRSEFIAHLTDMDSGYGIVERKVGFYVDDEFIGAGTTDVDGEARLTFPAEYRRGRHTFEAGFPGDAYYHSSSATAPQP